MDFLKASCLGRLKWIGVALALALIVPINVAVSAAHADSTTTDAVNPDSYVCNQPGYIDFENFTDGADLSATTIPGVHFTTTDGYTWLVGDFATGNYNGKYPNGSYTSQGTHWAWLGPNEGRGRIDLTDGPASSFSLLTSANTGIYLEAYSSDGTLLDVAGPSAPNTNTGEMSELKISRPQADIAYLIVHDTGNYFLVDSVCTDAPGVPSSNHGPSITPVSGPPGTTFHLTYSCPSGELPTVDITDPDGHIVDVYDVVTTPPVTGNGTDYTQTVQVGPDGSYLASLSCGGTAAGSVAFSVVAAGYVGLGDSYSSGEGASVFDPLTDSVTNRCHRSAAGYAWERMVAAAYGHGFDFAACSGALIEDFYHYNASNDGEVPQIDHVSRHQATSLVTLTVGGNNVGFPSVLADCIVGLFSPGGLGCAQRDQKLLSRALGWLQNGRPAGCYSLPGTDPATGQPAQICSSTPVPPLHQLYEDIASRLAPNGELVVAGYPRLFGSRFKKIYPNAFAPDVHYIGCQVGSRLPLQYGISAGDVGWLNQKGTDLNSTINSEVTRAAADIKATRPDVTIKFVPVDAQFDHHRICDTDTSWFHTLEFNGLDKPSQESFHPTDDGQKAYGEVIRAKI